MKDYRNFVIVNNRNNIVTSSFANCSSDVNYRIYNRKFPEKNNFNNYIDILKILNKHLAQIAKWKENNDSLSIYYILIPPKFCKVIKDKLYKKWLETHERANGFKIKQEELEQWKIFNILYKCVYADICFKPNNIYSSKNNINKNYRHIIFTNNVIDKMYNYLNKLDELNEIKTIDDLLKYR